MAGVIRGTGRATEIIAIRNNGSSIALRPDGTRRRLGDKIEMFDATAAPALSSDGGTMVFRAVDGRWYVRKENKEPVMLPDAAPAALPVLSHDGSTVAYRAADETTILVVRLADPGVVLLGLLDGCIRGTRITVGVFAPDGGRVVFGDERGNLCAWALTGWADPQRLFIVKTMLSGPVRVLAMNREGNRVAASAEDGAVEVWSVKGQVEQIASLELEVRALRPLLLDSGRKWLLTGEEGGTIAIHSLEKQGKTQIARLISTARGWTVLDHVGRFDGSETGIGALEWTGETADEAEYALPVDAFSESYFEPGLLAKLDDTRPLLLNEDVSDLAEDGYLSPPTVKIDPIDIKDQDAAGRLPITVRLADSGYPIEHLAEIRLYHNEKLVPQQTISGVADGVIRFKVRLSPGENVFRAIGVGPDGVEGPSASPLLVATDEVPPQSDMHVVAIGINDYVQPAWELFYARNDAETIVSELDKRGGRLRDRGGAPAYGNVQVTELLDAEAKKPLIEKQILGQSASPRDVLVVYFAGHGYALREEHGWEWYLLPYTGEWRHGGSQEEFDGMIRRHGVSGRRLMELLTQAEAKRVFLILDSCKSGAVMEAVQTLSASDPRAVDDAVTQKALRRIGRVGGIHILAAARAHEEAQELVSEPHGALTYLVLEGIRGAADGNGDEEISVREIVEYAYEEMPQLARRLGEGPISHEPVAYSRGTNFALVGL